MRADPLPFWQRDLASTGDRMRQTRKVVLIRAMQLVVSMLVAVALLDLIIGIFRPETGGVVKLELAAIIIVSFTIAALAASAGARLHHGDRHRKV